MQRLLFACCAAVLVFTVTHSLLFRAPAHAHSDDPLFPLRHCLVLTLNASLQPRTISSDLTCQPFLAQRFNAEQFAMLTPLAREKLIHPEKQTMASDLTNNNSVSIFANHARMWKAAAALSEPTLILEDDAIVDAPDLQILNRIIDNIINVQHRHNFVLKLAYTTPHWLGVHNYVITHLALKEWTQLSHIKPHTLFQCKCRTWWQTASSAAYIITPQAARNLLKYHLPMSEHVDVFIHKQGCISKNIDFILAYPAVILMSGRASTHNHETDWMTRNTLLFYEFMHNIKHDTCNA